MSVRWAAALAIPLVVLLGCSGSPTKPGTSQTPIVYAAMGASVTFGIGALPTSQGYVFQIADRMSAVGHEVALHNLGIPGARIEDLISNELEATIATNPTIVTVWTGSNDVIGGQSAVAFGSQLDSLLAELSSRTQALVFVGDLADLTQTPRYKNTPDPDVTPARLAAFNAEIQSSAAAHGALLVPVSGFEVTDELFTIDGFHPNNEGHTRLADIFWGEIEPRL